MRKIGRQDSIQSKTCSTGLETVASKCLDDFWNVLKEQKYEGRVKKIIENWKILNLKVVDN